jgi:uncharacterized protein Yka (UPF0111/DUF47 family)
MSRKELKQDLLFIKITVDNLFSLIQNAIDVIHARFHCHSIRIKALESRIDAIEKEVYDEY